MIGLLRGTVIDRNPARSGTAEIIVDVAGVGYRVAVLPGTAGMLGPDDTKPVILHIHTHVREDALVLYGFATRAERVCFEALLGAHGVGPALALAILGVLDPARLHTVLANDDLAALCEVPGVGKKTAQRLLLDLKSKLDVVDLPGGAENGADGIRAAAAFGGGVMGEARAALAGLGYGADEIKSTLSSVEFGSDDSVEDVIRKALRHMAGR